MAEVFEDNAAVTVAVKFLEAKFKALLIKWSVRVDKMTYNFSVRPKHRSVNETHRIFVDLVVKDSSLGHFLSCGIYTFKRSTLYVTLIEIDTSKLTIDKLKVSPWRFVV